MNILSRFKSEFSRYLRNHQYDEAENGVLFPRAGVFIGGALRVEDYRDSSADTVEISANLLLMEGLNHILDSTLVPDAGYAQIARWYYAPFSGNYTPNLQHTAAQLPAASTEFTNYTSATRLPVGVPTPADNAAAGATGVTAVLEMSPGGPYNLYGVNIVSAQSKNSTAGKALASVRFPRPKLDLAADSNSADKIALGYRLFARDET